MANHLSIEKKVLIAKLLCEGNSVRATSRLADVAFNSVLSMVPKLGYACSRFHDEKVINVNSKRVQADEIWSYVYSKEKNAPNTNNPDAGDAWTWTALDADSKLIISYLVANRDARSALWFMEDVAARLANAVQLTTDGHRPYLQAVENAFEGAIDYAMLVKIYGLPTGETPTERKYSPAECTGIKTERICGNPDEKHISTSYVERSNLNIRMHTRRFTRLTNAFSKKLENHCHAVSLYVVYYNWNRIHKTLRVTPAMEAGLTKRIMEFEDIVALMDKYPYVSK